MEGWLTFQQSGRYAPGRTSLQLSEQGYPRRLEKGMWSFLGVGVYSKTHNRRDAAVCSDTYEKKVIQTGSVIGLGSMMNVRAGPRYRDPR